MVKAEKRAYVRENFSFKVKFRTVAREEYELINKKGHLTSSTDKITHILYLSDTDSENQGIVFNNSIIDFLLQIDDKLDQVLALLSNKKEVSKVLLNQGLGKNISGTGMNILTDKLIEPNTIIYTSFILSRYPIVFIETFGEVVRVSPVDDDGKKNYCLGINFLDLNPNDRERIVACVFQWQRESIRRRKNETADSTDI